MGVSRWSTAEAVKLQRLLLSLLGPAALRVLPAMSAVPRTLVFPTARVCGGDTASAPQEASLRVLRDTSSCCEANARVVLVRLGSVAAPRVGSQPGDVG